MLLVVSDIILNLCGHFIWMRHPSIEGAFTRQFTRLNVFVQLVSIVPILNLATYFHEVERFRSKIKSILHGDNPHF